MFLYGLAATIGFLAFPHERDEVRIVFGGAGALALIASVGAAVYYFFRLDALTVFAVAAVLPWLPFVFAAFPERHHKTDETMLIEKTGPVDTMSLLLLGLVAAFDVLAMRALAQASTAEAIRSPWEVTHPIFFLWVFLGSIALVTLCWRSRYHHLSLMAAAFHLFTMLSPALLVYVIGYGFDPFIHQATERLILDTGSVSPKPPYYLGQYAIVVTLANFFPIGTEAVDRLLVPTMAALMLPLSAVYLLRRGFMIARHEAVLAALGLFLLPIGAFVATVPQSLADVFAVMTFILGISWLHDHRPTLPFVFLTAAAALAIHPLSGIPTFFFLLYLMFFKLKPARNQVEKINKMLAASLIIIGSVVAIPLLLRSTSADAPGMPGSVTEPIRQALLLIGAPDNETRHAPVIDFIQLVTSNGRWLIILLAAGGGIILYRKSGYRRAVFIVGGSALAMLATAAWLKSGWIFKDVIAYEQANYADRLLRLMLLSLSPLVLAGGAWWWRRLRTADAGIRLFHVLLLCGVISALAYDAFPRNDAFASSRGYSTSIHDVSAVRDIEKRADRPHVVLANQSVSAAALREFGFRTYFGDQYFYPIPTGGKLYQRYLDMIYQGTKRETMEEAMRSVKVNLSYFVINAYWQDADKIAAEAKKTADAWFEVGGGKLTVFEYRMK